MSMSKQDFIALANVVRELWPNLAIPANLSTPQAHAEKNGQQAQWLKTREALADFCAQQNSNFKRDRWLSYIAGECGPNGGAVKSGVAK
jgi:hypothetical protein